MKTLKSNFVVKVIAVVLFAACLAAAGVSGLGVLYGYEAGIYTEGVKSYYESGMIRSVAYQRGYDLLDAYNAGASSKELEDNWFGDPSNIDFTLTELQADGIEKRIASTIDPQQSYGFENTWDCTYSTGDVYDGDHMSTGVKERTFSITVASRTLAVIIMTIYTGQPDFQFCICLATV